MKIFEHRGIESLRRKLNRNAQLRTLCGFNEGEYEFLNKRKHLVPPANNSGQIELDNMIEEMSQGEERYKLDKMENLMGDAGYDKENQALRYGRYTKGKKSI